MTRSVRALSMTIGFLLVLHFGVMAVDPVAMHAVAEATATSFTADEDRDAADSSAHTAHTAHASMLSAETCIEAEGVAPQSRVPLDPVAFIAVVPSSAGVTSPVTRSFHPDWSPPALDGKDIRALLQVFLN